MDDISWLDSDICTEIKFFKKIVTRNLNAYVDLLLIAWKSPKLLSIEKLQWIS